MEAMIHGKYINQGEDLAEIMEMRKAVFGTGEEEEDPQAVHLLVSLKKNAEDPGIRIGCGRLILDLENFRFIIDRLGILEEYQRCGYGEFALRALVDKVNQCGAEQVFIRRADVKTEEAACFFQKMFFAPAEEEDYLTAKIEAFHTCKH